MLQPYRNPVSDLEKLQNVYSLADFADLLKYKAQDLSYIIYKISAPKYTIFHIPKKSGGTREIKAPCEKLKQLQKCLAELLYGCLNEIEKNNFSDKHLNSVSFGFRRQCTFTDKKGKEVKHNYSIIENARLHKNRRWVLNLDLKDFFPSFNFGRVRGFFIKDKNFSLEPKIATLIAQIACDGKALPQGSPCSPIISVLIGQILDVRLVRLATKYKVTYTRYADDITFSTNLKEFPQQLAVEVTEGDWRIGEKLKHTISKSGFTVNDKKTRMAFRRRRQQVTGLVVNAKVNITQDYYRLARAMCHSLFTKGEFYLKNRGHIVKFESKEKPLNRLSGILSFIDSIKRGNLVFGQDERERAGKERHKKGQDKEKQVEKTGFMKLYKKFLFYKYYLALDKPLIITEGKTDIVHLRCAIKKLANFPLLGAIDKNNPSKFNYDISFLKHRNKNENSGNRISQILVGDGGVDTLKAIPLAYKYFLWKNTNIKLKHPVIIILDNDKGISDRNKKTKKSGKGHGNNKENSDNDGKPCAILSTLKESFNISIDTKNPLDFYHITKNLYLVLLTKGSGGKDRAIEDLYPPELRNIGLNGKSFCPSNTSHSKQNNPNTYGKDEFARYVIAANLSKMTQKDFVGFKPLLENIEKVIKDYANSIKAC